MADVTTTANIVRQAPYLEDIQKKILDQAMARGEVGVDVPAIQVAGLDPLTEQARTLGAGLGQYQPYLTTGAETLGTGVSALQERAAGVPGMFAQAAQQAAGTTGAYDPTSAAAFMDPYQQAVTQDALGEMQRQADIQRNQLAAQAVGAGAFGGARQGIAGTELDRNLADMQSRRIFEDLSRNYGQAQAAAQTTFENQQRRQQGVAGLLAGLGQAQSQEAVRLAGGLGSLGTAQTNISGYGQNLLSQQAQMQSQLGALGQTQAQRELDAARQTALQQAYEPFQRIAWSADVFKPSIGSAGSTLGQNVAPSPSPLSQYVSLGIGALGLNKALNNPIGRLFGTQDDPTK